jgi:tetratricopeptide (TPR) repeat protein
MALAALEQETFSDEPTRCELLLALGEAQARGGDLSRAKETFASAADIARMISAPEQLARAALGYGGRFVWFRAGTDQRLIPLLEEALDTTHRDNPLRARLLVRLAGALRDDPAAKRREELCEEAVQVARQVGDLGSLAYALEGTYAALSLPRDVDAWLATSRELTQLAGRARDMELAFYGHLGMFGALMMRGDVIAADAEISSLVTIGLKLRQPAQLWLTTVARATRAAFAGRFQEAERLAEQSLAREGSLGTLGGVDETTFYYVMQLQSWALRRERGELAELLQPIEYFASEHVTFFMFQCLLANMYSQLGDVVKTRAQVERLAAADFAGLGVGTEWFAGASLLAEPCALLHEASYAQRIYDALRPYGEYNVISQPEFNLGSGSRYLGILATTNSQFEAAAHHFERALERNAQMGARPALAHTQLDYASMLLARDEGDDGSRARELITTAVRTYKHLGMKGRAESAQSST